VLTSSKEQFLLVNNSEKNIVRFSRKTNWQVLSSIDCFTLMRHSDQFRSFSTHYLQFMGSTVVTMCHMHFLLTNKHKTSYEVVFRYTVAEAAKLGVNVCVPHLFVLISKPLFTKQWEQCDWTVKLKHVVCIEDRAAGGMYNPWDSASSMERKTLR
jgi:hypothetical protein